jgi:outer membrane receptor protein involved in Fe transport
MAGKIKRFLLAMSLLIIGVGLANAQVTTGRISGTVTDPNGAVVPNAAVSVTNLETNQSRQTNTGDDGSFAVQLLPPGRYRVEVSAAGFQKFEVEAVVNITESTTVDAQLGVTGGTTTVTVEPEAPVLQAETSQTGRVIEGATLRQLPLPTRNFQQLLTLNAGAQSSVSNNTDLGRGDNNISVNGQRTTSNSVRINGVDANSIGTNSTPNLAVPATDSLQEFIVQTSLYDASNGRNAGGNIEAVTRSGGNDFRGNAYLFLRNKALNANEPFVKARGLERPVLTRYQYGGTLGGRIIRDRAFFFGSYQGTRERNGLSLNNSLTFPSIPARLRDDNRTAAALAATFGINPALINPVAVNLLNLRLPDNSFAIPSSGTAGLTARTAVPTVQSGVSRFRENQFNANIDVNLSDSHTLASKFFFADNPTTQANYNFAGTGNRLEGQPPTQLIGFGADFDNRQFLYSLTDTYVFNSNISNQARFGFSRLRVTSIPQEPFTAAQIGISSPLANLYPGAPTIQVAGVDSSFFFGSSPLADQSSRINAWTLQDTLSIVAGKHRIRTGGEFRYSTVKFFFNAFSRGQLIFASFNDFLQGSGVSILGSGIYDRAFRVKDFSAFVQDDFKVNERLTLNLGLRYDFYGLPADSQNRLVNFVPEQYRLGAPPNGVVQAEGGQLAGVPTVTKTLAETDKNNFSPRVGFAYRLDKAGNLVLRGGYGIYYDRISTRFANTQLFNFPYLALGVGLVNSAPLPIFRPLSNPFVPLPQPTAFPTAATIPSPLSALSPVGVPVSGIFVDPELKTPYVQQYNLGVQWQFVKNTVLEVGYVGNKGTNLFQVIAVNQPIYNRAANSFVPRLAPANILSINKNVTGGVHQVQTTANSNYNSLQVTLTRRFAQGLQLTGAYTFGRSFDFYSGGTVNELTNTAGDQFDWRTNYGRSDFNREQRLVISGVYDLPKYNYESAVAKALLNDWQIAGVAVFQSGLPFSIIDNPGNAVISRANFRPGFSGDIEESGSISSRLNQYFNPSAFVASCPFGTVSNNTVNCSGTTGIGTVTNPFFDPNAPFGNTPRNFLTGPGQKNVDISLIKFIPINERFRAEFRAEFFNAFNWVNYANPVTNIALFNPLELNRSLFGRIISASTGPRVIQFGFKLNF